MKKLLALILASIMLLSLVACGKDADDADDFGSNDDNEFTDNVYEDILTYDVNDDGDLEITGVISDGIKELNIKIPAEINGRDVTGIGDEAFKACVTLKSITFEGKLLYIGEAAFYGCTGLKTIVLPETVENIKANAFRACTSLEAITLSSKLDTIELAAFWDCTALKSISLPASLKTVEGGAFWNCAALTEVVIPASVETVGDTAFYGCTALKTATYSSTTELGESVFDNCGDVVVTVK